MTGINKFQIRFTFIFLIFILCLSIYTVNRTSFDLEAYASLNNQIINDNRQIRELYPIDYLGECPKLNSEQEIPLTNYLQQHISENTTAQKNYLINTETLANHEPTNKKIPEVGIWFYSNFYNDSIPISIIDSLLTFKVNTIYFAGSTSADWQDPDKYRSYANFVCYAYSKGLDVYAVTLEDPFFAYAKETEILNEFANFIKATKGLFETFMVDVEPHTLHLADPLLFVPQYIRMSLILQQVANHYNVTYVDTVPYWYHSVIKNIGISSGIDILGGNEVNFMDYSYTFNQSITNINKLLPDIIKPVTVSIKVTPGYGDPYLNEFELTKTINHLQNNSISYGVFESQYLLRNMPDLFER